MIALISALAGYRHDRVVSALISSADSPSEAVRLAAVKALMVEAASHIVETPPWGFESGHSFLNAVLRISTTRSDSDFDGIIADTEAALGRAHEVTPADGQVVVTGSLYVVGAARATLRRG